MWNPGLYLNLSTRIGALMVGALMAPALGALLLSNQHAAANGNGSPAECDSHTSADIIASLTGTGDLVTYTAPAGRTIVSVCIKSGNNMFGANKHSNALGNDQYESNCYDVSGVGTATVTVARLGSGNACQAISHIDVVLGASPSAPPAPPAPAAAPQAPDPGPPSPPTPPLPQFVPENPPAPASPPVTALVPPATPPVQPPLGDQRPDPSPAKPVAPEAALPPTVADDAGDPPGVESGKASKRDPRPVNFPGSPSARGQQPGPPAAGTGLRDGSSEDTTWTFVLGALGVVAGATGTVVLSRKR
jgi:hypothetical protein